MAQSEQWRTLRGVVAVTAPLGALIGVVLSWFIAGPSGRSMVAGAVTGFLVTAGFVSFDAGWAMGLIPRRWREAPFLVVIVTRSLVWLAIIVFGIGLPLLTIARLPFSDVADRTFIQTVGASFVAALLFNFVGQVNRLLGQRVLLRLILGRYHRPREEVRVFLLIDLRGSTQIAERLGNLTYHRFVKRFISDVTVGAIRHGGEVHRYVGDEVILTWTATEGLRDAACVRTVFAFADTLQAAHPEYESEFGVVPDYWAGLHLGSVVAGEVGTVKHEIAFLGDTLNAAARIAAACKTYQREFLASADVISALELPPGVATESLGRIELRGIEAPVELFSVTRTAGGS